MCRYCSIQQEAEEAPDVSDVPMVDSDCAGPEHCHHSDCSSPSNVSASSHLRTIPIIYSSWKPMADIQDAVMMEMAPSTHAQLNTVLSQVHQCIHTIFANYRCSMRWQIGTVADLHDGIASKADLYVLLASTCSRTTQAEIESALTDSKSESSWNAYCGPKTKTKKVSYLFTPVDLSIAVMSTAVYYTVLAIRTLGHVPYMNSVSASAASGLQHCPMYGHHQRQTTEHARLSRV